jgi:hypothetical protein
VVILQTQYVQKTEYSLRKLILEIRELHFACLRISGQLTHDCGITLDDIDRILVAVDHALVTVRSLDKIFEDSDKSAYLTERNSFEGNVVRGLTGPRNASVHYEDLVEPDVPRVVGPTDGPPV